MVEISNTKSNQSSAHNAYRDLMLALNSPHSRRKYEGRLQIFFDYIGIPHLGIEERCGIFISEAQNDEKCASDKIIQFLAYQRQRQKGRKSWVLRFRIMSRRSSYFATCLVSIYLGKRSLGDCPEERRHHQI